MKGKRYTNEQTQKISEFLHSLKKVKITPEANEGVDLGKITEELARRREENEASE